ncbi:transposable element Tcb2 transposase [Trichonephila clavipes]|nr:transposable element Tcb2 transposase [Trichonephila clavipes]
MADGWSTRQLGPPDCVVRRCWDQWIQYMSFTRRPCSGRPRQTNRREDHRIVRNARVQATASSASIQAQMPSHRRLRLEWCRARGNWTTARWDQVVLSDESTFNLSNDDNRVRVGKPSGERLNPAFALQKHFTPTAAGVMVWGVIAYNTWSTLLLFFVPKTVQRYVHDILQPHVLPLMQRLPGAIFQQVNARPPTPRVLQDCLRTVTTLSWPARSPD